MMKKTFVILFLITACAAFLTFYKSQQVPLCLNADEAAFGYNAYTLLTKGTDEFGTVLPLRLKSFFDFKMPMYSYLSIPFVGIFGLNEFSTRLLSNLVGIALVPLMYFFTFQLFKDKKLSLLTAFFTATTLWLFIITRQAHEAPLAAIFILGALVFMIKNHEKWHLKNFVIANFLLLCAAFTYHPGRLFLLVLVVYQMFDIFYVSKKKISSNIRLVLIAGVILMIPFLVDLKYGANRVSNLLFYKSVGFTERIVEYLNEDGNRVFHNKLTEGVREVGFHYLSQFSVDFLVRDGDANPRFGIPYMNPINPILYIAVFFGFYFLFKEKNEHRWLLTMLLFVSPIGNALTWQDSSITRNFFFIVPFLIIATYGCYFFITSLNKQWKKPIIVLGILTYFFFGVISWDLYFNHFPKRHIVIRSWQCGYKELVSYVNDHYKTTDNFYITNKHGQPYIFFLFYNKYSPAKFLHNLTLSNPDQYGFTRVETFDKFHFNFTQDIPSRNTVVVGYPDDFNNWNIDQSKIKKVIVGGEEIFWMYKN